MTTGTSWAMRRAAHRLHSLEPESVRRRARWGRRRGTTSSCTPEGATYAARRLRARDVEEARRSRLHIWHDGSVPAKNRCRVEKRDVGEVLAEQAIDRSDVACTLGAGTLLDLVHECIRN